MTKARVAIIGCGNIGTYHLGNLMQCLDIADLVGFCDIIPERAEEFVAKAEMGKAQSNYLDLLNDAKLSEGTIENRMVNEQVLKDVRALIDELPDCQREVVFMRYYQDLSFKDIADITGVSINTALGRMRYAIINMRRIAAEKCISLTLEQTFFIILYSVYAA